MDKELRYRLDYDQCWSDRFQLSVIMNYEIIFKRRKISTYILIHQYISFYDLSSSQLNMNSFNLIRTLIFVVNIQSQFLPFGSLPFHDNLVLCKRIPTNRRIWTWHLFHDHCARLNLFDRSKILIIPFDLFLTLKNSCSFLPLLYS